MKKMTNWLLVVTLLCCFAFSACTTSDNPAPTPKKQHELWTQELIDALDNDAEAKALLVKSLEEAKRINPDRDTNPAQTLEEYYDYLDWSTKCMPWSIIPQPAGRSLYDKIDQSIDYFYFILDIPLDELKDRELYYPSLQYIEPFKTWMTKYHDGWALFLDSEESWKPEYADVVLTDPMFGLQNGWYEDPSNWHSFNDFFIRKLASPDKRPIASPEDDSVVASGADSQPQGVWPIDDNGDLVQHEGVIIKSRQFNHVDDLLGPESAYLGQFNGGTLTHTFLDVNDYHRYHFPVSGTIREIRKIQAIDAAGGITTWDADAKRYRLECDIPGWQMIETRGLVIIETENYGLVAMLPIGMSQICSVNFEESLKVGDEVKKGDPLGWFLFGGSDIVYLFQKGVNFELETTDHILQGNKLGTLSK
jgi:phosphatidylserine decarboxylase